MKPLSQSEYGDLRSLYDQVYSVKSDIILEEFAEEDFIDLTDEEIEEQVEEFFLECIEEGYDIDEIEQIICEHVDAETLSEDRYDSAVATSKANAQKPEVKRANRREALKKVGAAAKKVGSALKKGAKAAGKAAQGGIGLAARAVGTAQRAGDRIKSAAKSGYERGRQGSGGSSSSSSGSSSSSSGSSSSGSSDSGSSSGGGSSAPAPKKRKDGLLKRGLKKLIRGAGKAVSAAAGAVKAGADSVTDRARKEELEATGLFSEKEIEAIMEAEVQELYKGKHGQSEKEYQDSRSDAGKMISGDSKHSGAAYSHRSYKGVGKPAKPGERQKNQGKMDRGTRADLEYRKANLKKEEVEQVDEDSRRRSNKQDAERVKLNIKHHGSNYTPPRNYDPDANRGQGAVLTHKQMEKKRRKALRQEEVEATGLFSEKEIESILKLGGY